jgi:hypothetical protein
MSISGRRRVTWQENSNGLTGSLRPSGRRVALPMTAAQRIGSNLEGLPDDTPKTA